jgi:hypothetical protein
MEELAELGRDVECGGGDAPPPWILGVQCKFTAVMGYYFNVSDESDESTSKILSQILSCNVEDGIDTAAPGNFARWPPLPQPQRVLCPPSADFPNCGDAFVGDTCEQDENGEPYKCPAGTAKDGDPAEEGKSITLECAVVQGKRAEGLWSSPCAELSCAAGQRPVSNMADCTYGGESFFADGATKLMTSGAICTVTCVDGFKIFKGGSTGLICVQGQLKGLDSNAEVVERLPKCENALMKFETVHKVEGSVAFAMDAAQVEDLLAPSNIEASKAAFAESLALSLGVAAAALAVESLSAASRRLALVLDERPMHARRISTARRLQAIGIEVKYSVEVEDPDAAAALVQDIESVDTDELAEIANIAAIRLQERFPDKTIVVTGATVSTPRAVEYERTTGEIPGIGEEPVEEGALDLEGLTTGLQYGAVVAVFLIGAGLGYKQYTKKQAERRAAQERAADAAAREEEEARLAMGFGSELPLVASEQLEAMQREEREVLSGNYSVAVSQKPATDPAPLAIIGPAGNTSSQPERDPGPMIEDEHVLPDGAEPAAHEIGSLRNQPSWAV